MGGGVGPHKGGVSEDACECWRGGSSCRRPARSLLSAGTCLPLSVSCFIRDGDRVCAPPDLTAPSAAAAAVPPPPRPAPWCLPHSSSCYSLPSPHYPHHCWLESSLGSTPAPCRTSANLPSAFAQPHLTFLTPHHIPSHIHTVIHTNPPPHTTHHTIKPIRGLPCGGCPGCRTPACARRGT